MSWRVILGLVLVASTLLLNVTFTKFATNRIVTHWDDRVTRTIPDAPLLVTGSVIYDMVCLRGYPCKTRAVALETGLYPRFTGQFLAAMAGLILPYLFLLAGSHLLLQRLLGATRIACGTLMIALSMLGLTPVAMLFYRATSRFHVPIERVLGDSRSGMIFLFIATAVFVLLEGLSLLLISRSPTESM